MSHLSVETLARLIDEAPDAAEARHLDACADCRRELDAMRDDLTALRELPDLLPPPPEAWPALERRLRYEGLIRAPIRGRASGAARLLRLAAAVTLFLGGGVTGFALRAGLPGASDPASGGPDIAAVAPAATEAEAIERLEQAESAYLAALAHYSELTGQAPTSDPIARLAALEEILVTTREALTAAPADPVLNGYHLTALAQRDATVKQITLASADPWY